MAIRYGKEPRANIGGGGGFAPTPAQLASMNNTSTVADIDKLRLLRTRAQDDTE